MYYFKKITHFIGIVIKKVVLGVLFIFLSGIYFLLAVPIRLLFPARFQYRSGWITSDNTIDVRKLS